MELTELKSILSYIDFVNRVAPGIAVVRAILLIGALMYLFGIIMALEVGD